MNKQTGTAIKHAILLLRKTFHVIRFPARSLDEAEELQGGDRLSKPSSEFAVKDKLLPSDEMRGMHVRIIQSTRCI